VNFVVGVKAGMAIPGNSPGKYTGSTHGPPTGAWAVWSGMSTVKRADVQAGDILLWLGHMGIAIDNKQMISALNPRVGTKITVIDAGVGRGPLVRIGRL
jgi:cell wall-associated NlpC family hydrolase